MSETSKTEELLARELDMNLRDYQAMEWGETEIHDLYLRALERIAMRHAVNLEDPKLIPAALRDEVVRLARIVVARS